jgi:[protein-PII] uridylyltransferase
METELQKGVDPADRRLDVYQGPDPRALPSFKRFLRIENERLRIRHRLGLAGPAVARARSSLVDLVVRRACHLVAARLGPAGLSGERDRFAVVALGGYGRQELAPHSDVDLLFLHDDRSSRSVASLVEGVLAVLWDAGLTLGHCFRTVGDCVSMARDDVHSRTALTEARLLTGSDSLFKTLLDHRDELVARPNTTEAFLESLRFELAERYARFGQAVCLQEPNVKESAGGLRDLHAVLWVGHTRFGCQGLDALWHQGRIAEAEHVAARRSYEFLMRVRNEAHFSTGRRTDLLTLDLQPGLAESLGYRPRRGRLASEVFMRDYYQRASELHRFCRTFLLRHAAPRPRRRFTPGLLRRRPRGTFEARDGRLHPRASSESLGSPRRLMEAFTLAQNEDLELSEELKLDIRGSLSLLDREYRSSRDAGRAFLRLLERKGRVAATLRTMHETGFLGRFLPEFGRVTFLVQHDFFHRYTVDEHTLKALEALDRIVAATEPALVRLRKVLDEVEDPVPLYLGLLLHDVGKGHGGGHVGRGVRIGERLCARLEIPPRVAEHALFLVGAHLEMSKLSQQRDLTEPGLIEGFARRVGTVDRLNTLLLLTYADHCGVGPGIWNEWKGLLLWDLYEKTRERLRAEAGTPERDRRPPNWPRASARLQADFPASEVERHFALMPEKYLRATDGADMVRHFLLLETLGERALVAEWRTPPEEHFTELTIAARDRAGLFASLAGTLTAHALDILSVDLFTRDDGLVVDVFKVRAVGDHAPVPPDRWPRVEEALRAALEGRYDVAAAVDRWRGQPRRRPWRRAPGRPVVRFDSESSASRTVIEVRADDEPGLAFRIASTLAACGLSIGFAKIATEKSHALDVFYVAGPRGKLDEEESARVGAALMAVLGEAPAVMKEDG